MRGLLSTDELEAQLATARLVLAELEGAARSHRPSFATARNAVISRELGEDHDRKVGKARHDVQQLELKLSLAAAAEHLARHPRVRVTRWSYRWGLVRNVSNKLVLSYRGAGLDLLLEDGSRHEIELPPITGAQLIEILEQALSEDA